MFWAGLVYTPYALGYADGDGPAAGAVVDSSPLTVYTAVGSINVQLKRPDVSLGKTAMLSN